MSRSHKGALARSRSIDHQIDVEREKRQNEIQLLILGGASSGKSTFIKQLRLHHGDGLPDPERQLLISHVYENLMNAINVIIDHMTQLGIEFDDLQNREFAQQLVVQFPKTHGYYMTQSPLASPGPSINAKDPVLVGTKDSPLLGTGRSLSFPDYAQVSEQLPKLRLLCQDERLQECFSQKSKFSNKMKKAEEYFFKHNVRVLHSSYLPSVLDVLYIRKPTLGVMEHHFCYNGLYYRVIDVAGQKNQRKKWIHFFDNVTAVLFFAALSGYCENLEEDKTTNSLVDSLATFREVAHNSFLDKTDFILFLNKKDVFDENLPNYPLSECFPNYEGPQTSDVCLEFVRAEFLKRKPQSKQVYTHVTCAVDVDMMKRIIDDIMNIIVEINLRRVSHPL